MSNPASTLPPALPSATGVRIQGISSMATRAVLNDLVAAWSQPGIEVEVESVGGVDVTRRVLAGEAFDLVVLAADAIDRLIASGHVQAGSRRDLVHSGVAVAVQQGTRPPDLSSEASVRAAVLAAPSVGVSTGPSGVQLLARFEQWGIGDALRAKLIQAPPGVPVAGLVARGEVALGFQQLSELLNVAGVDVVGPLPPSIQINTTFSAGLCRASGKPEAVRQFLDYLTSPAAAATYLHHGMTPA